MLIQYVIRLTTIAMLVGSLLATTSGGELVKKLRRPTALALTVDESLLLVANRDAGSVSIVDVAAQEVIGETVIGKRLADMRRIGESQYIVVDEATHELLVLEASRQRVNVKHRIAVPPYPVRATANEAVTRAYVTSLWPRRISVVDLQPQDGDPHVIETIDLPFAPRELLLLEPEKRLIVADSHAGRLAVVDTTSHKLMHVNTFPGHNIRGMSLSNNREMLIIGHQMLNELGHTVRNDVHWGLVMSNDLRWLQLARVLENSEDLYRGAQMHPLGEAGKAMGDPTALAVGPDGMVVVALGGVGEVAFGKEEDFSMDRASAGRRPAAVVCCSDGKRAFIANMYSDSISLLDLKKRKVTAEISLGPMKELDLVQRGELLFHDASLSHDQWMSCHSCHTDGHTNSMLNDNFNDQSFGAPKRVMSLLGSADTAPFRWNGTARDLNQQIRDSVKNTMQYDHDVTQEQVDALIAYVKTLPAPPPIDLMRGERDEKRVAAGRQIFEARGCVNCHAHGSYTTPEVYDVGIEDQLGRRRFNPPSLIGVGQRGPYFHDNRATHLEDVFVKHRHQLETELTKDELAALLAFLRHL